MTSRCCRMEAASNTHCSVVEDFLTNPYQVKNQISTYIENLDLDDNNDGAVPLPNNTLVSCPETPSS